MGVIYKLTQEVVDFIVKERQSNPLFSCRQLAESASQKFSLRLSKSSVHDVLKESGIITPRGRKPKVKFEIPQEKRKQIQDSLAQVKLLPDPVAAPAEPKIEPKPEPVILNEVKEAKVFSDASPTPSVVDQNDEEISPEYEGAGRVFLKAVLWDLGIFSEEDIKEEDWGYYLTYCKGVKVDLDNGKSFFIDLPVPLERCIKETADGLINNIKPLIISKIPDEELFKACMDAQEGFKISKISIVDRKDHILLEFNDIMEYKRKFNIENVYFVENNEIDKTKRLKLIFFPQHIDNNEVIYNILNLKGFDTTSKNENTVTLLIEDSYENKIMLQEAVKILNGMYLCDEQNKLVKVKLGSAVS